jgi:hypothetical protein
MEVATDDQGDVERLVAQLAYSLQAAEATPDDNNTLALSTHHR